MTANLTAGAHELLLGLIVLTRDMTGDMLRVTLPDWAIAACVVLLLTVAAGTCRILGARTPGGMLAAGLLGVMLSVPAALCAPEQAPHALIAAAVAPCLLALTAGAHDRALIRFGARLLWPAVITVALGLAPGALIGLLGSSLLAGLVGFGGRAARPLTVPETADGTL